MKRPLAYLTAAWSGEPDVDMELAAHYCRLAYEAGFSPICPLLYLPLFLNDSVPEDVYKRQPGDSRSGQLRHPDWQGRPHRPGVPHLAGGRHRSAL